MGEQINRLQVGIVGASGYGGVQLVRLLQDHPAIEIAYLGGDSSAGKKFADLYPHLGHVVNLTIEPIDVDVIASRCQAVFLALPNGLACELAPKLLAKGCSVLDLSADYRFTDLDTYTLNGIKFREPIGKQPHRLSTAYQNSIVPNSPMPNSSVVPVATPPPASSPSRPCSNKV